MMTGGATLDPWVSGTTTTILRYSPDKKALAALKEAKRKLDDLYRGVTSRKAIVVQKDQI
jgi:hypothetical protein